MKKNVDLRDESIKRYSARSYRRSYICRRTLIVLEVLTVPRIDQSRAHNGNRIKT